MRPGNRAADSERREVLVDLAAGADSAGVVAEAEAEVVE